MNVETPHGPARAHLHRADDPRGALVLGHGAGGGVEAPDLLAATEAALGHGFSVALVEQPYRVAGRKSSPPAHHLDAAWIAVMEHLGSSDLRDLPVVAGGRSAGARVACRTAAATDAAGVLCLAFPLQPPARKGKEPGPSRLDELDAVKVPDAGGAGRARPLRDAPGGQGARGRGVPGDHSLRTDPQAVAGAVGSWLAKLAL